MKQASFFTRSCCRALSGTATVLAVAFAAANPASAAAPVQPASASGTNWNAVVEHYAAIAAALAADATDGVAGHARELTKALGPIPAVRQAGNQATELRSAHAAAAKLHDRQLTLEQAREVYKSLSQALLPSAKLHYVKGASDPDWAVFHCPMAPGSWIQTGDVAANPYYGSQMLKCGTKQAMLGSSGPDEPAPPKQRSDPGRHHGTGGHSH